MTQADQAMRAALQHHQAGRLQQAEQFYRQVLTHAPEHAEALHYLGVIAAQHGRNGVAVQLLERAVTLRPDYAEAHFNLGIALKDKGHVDAAIAAFRRAVALRPDWPKAHTNLGVALKTAGELDEAIAAYRRAIDLYPDYAEAHGNLGVALAAQGQLEEAIAAYRRAIALRPDYAEAHNNLGVALGYKGRLDEAMAACAEAVRLRPNLPEALNNLGNALKSKGQLDEAIAAYRKAMALAPNRADVQSNLVYALHFHPASDADAIAEELGRWNREHAEPLRKFIRPHGNDRSPDRRLQIGYVSPDLRRHPVGQFLLPLLAHHDKSRFEVFAYAHVSVPDAMKHRLHSHTEAWRNIVGFSDAQAADLVRQDRVDILIDLTLHMANNRLLVFARKPAPLQVTYLAYAGSSGLTTIDYRISDPWLDPTDSIPGTPPKSGAPLPFPEYRERENDSESPGVRPTPKSRRESLYSEQTVRLPETYWCYQPIIDPVDTGPLPALERGYITFGCLNNFCKVSEPALAAWIELLRTVPNARLLLHAHEGSHQRRVRNQLEHSGIDSQRLKFVGLVPDEKYFNLYRQIDIALDPFPYGGGTTTCDALWMGVPVVSLAGKTAVGRGGLSILSNLGLADLVARSEEDCVRIARELAHDLPRLGKLRSILRNRMEQSPLMDAPRFTRNIEAVYRQMWRNWCESDDLISPDST